MTLLIATDLFNRANTASGLGTADTGQAWSALIATMKIATNRARASSNVRSASVIDAGAGGGDSTIEALCGSGSAKGGYALYFRATDANNWWRLAVNAGSFQYASGSHQEAYQTNTYICRTDIYYYPTYEWLGVSADFSSGYDQSGGWAVPGDNRAYATSCSISGSSTGYTTVTDYSTAYTWVLVLQKCVAGVVTTVATTGDLGAAPTHLQVIANGAAITGFCSTTSSSTLTQRLTASDAFNSGATKHGVGYSEVTTYGNTDGLDNFTISVANTAPNAPTLTSPATGTIIDRAVTQRLAWTPDDPDAGDSQSKFDLQYKLVGAGSWTTITQPLPNSFWDAVGGTFTAGDHEFQVRTYDAAGLVGPWSPSSFFTAADTPGVPSITAPISGAAVPATASVTWSVSAQTSYRIRTVADIAGAADTSTVYFDTGEVTDTATRTVGLTFPVNGRWEHIQVQIKDTTGLWSSWADCRVPVSYARPMIPLMVLTPLPASASITVAITNPSPEGAAPVVAYNDVYVSSAVDPEIRWATQIAPNATWTFPEPASDRIYEVRVVAVGTNDATSSSRDMVSLGIGIWL